MSWPSPVPSSGAAAPKTSLFPAPPALAADKALRKDHENKDRAEVDASKISAYARLDFDNYTFFVQTLQVVLGRKSSNELLLAALHSVDVHLSSGKAILRRHAKIFYNFGTQRFEISVLGRNGAFVHNLFVAKGLTVPLTDNTKIQIGDIPFTFVLPSTEPAQDKKKGSLQLFNPLDALNLRTNLYTSPRKPLRLGTATPEPAEKLPVSEKEAERRSGVKADLVRRLSIARRKSLLSASADEISALIAELEADPLTDISALDDDVRALLHPKEEDEIDRLVLQHTMQESTMPSEMDVAVLDREIASLAPLLDSQDKRDGKDEKPAHPKAPRMGKPATIQPPANRIYGRLPLAPYPGYTPNYSGAPAYNGYSAYNAYYQPPPLLQVVVETIAVEPAPSAEVPFRAITVSADFHETPSTCVLKTRAPTTRPKMPLRRREPFRKPKAQIVKEVPEQHKAKPAMSILAMVSMVLKDKKLTLHEISEAIKEVFPYYKYCPDGWQFSVTHSVKYNKMFLVVHQPEAESDWLWEIDTKFLEEKEKTRKRQQEVAMAKAKEAALRLTEFRRNGYQYQGQYPNPYAGGPPAGQLSRTPSGGPKPKSIAEIASEIRRDPHSKTPLYFQKPEENIKAQLAATRGSPATSPAPSAPLSAQGASDPASGTGAAGPVMNTDTKKSLTYLQKELFTLYKARKLSYNTAVTTEIITKALATTIAQVNIIGAKAGCGDNALTFLVEKAPLQVSKILDIALSKSIKERQTPSSPEKAEKAGNDGSSGNVSGNVSGNEDKAPSSGLSKPSFSGGLSRPSFAGLGKPQSFTKPGALAKPPQFLSNKLGMGEKSGEKRSTDDDMAPRKAMKMDEEL